MRLLANRVTLWVRVLYERWDFQAENAQLQDVLEPQLHANLATASKFRFSFLCAVALSSVHKASFRFDSPLSRIIYRYRYIYIYTYVSICIYIFRHLYRSPDILNRTPWKWLRRTVESLQRLWEDEEQWLVGSGLLLP